MDGRPFSWASIALLFLVPRVVLAGDPRVAVVDVRAQSSSAIATADALREKVTLGLAAHRVVVPTHPAIAAAHKGGRTLARAQAKIAEARKLSVEGRKLFETFKPAEAEDKLRKASELFETHAGVLEGSAEVTETYLTLAQVFFATDREHLARDVFYRALQLDPTLVLDPSRVPTKLVQVFDDVKKRALTGRLGRVVVESEPGPASVYLDGRPVGATPATLENVPVGSHSIVVRRNGYAPWLGNVSVSTFQVHTVQADLVLDRHPSLADAFEPNPPKDAIGLTVSDYLDGLASEVELEILFVGRVTTKGVLEIRGYRSADHAFGAVLTFPTTADGDSIARGLLESAVAVGWLKPIHARRSLAAGGGALDETARWAVRVATAGGGRIGSTDHNFPHDRFGPVLSAAVDVRLQPRLLASVETGFSFTSGPVLLVDSAGNAASSGVPIDADHVSVSLSGGARYYLGVSTVAPYVAGSVGARYDRVDYRESLPQDRIYARPGIGFEGSAAFGADVAFSTSAALLVEARMSGGILGVSEARLDFASTPADPDRRFPIGETSFVSWQIRVGYLRMF